jgi:heme/copper-type cytochrome/quinol oxidase subunit 3
VADAAVRAAGLRRRDEHHHPRDLELHDALGAAVDQARQPHTNAFGSVFFGLTGLHGAHVFVGLTLLAAATVRAFRGHYSAESHHGVEIPGIYWHFVDVMWIVVYTTVYIL